MHNEWALSTSVPIPQSAIWHGLPICPLLALSGPHDHGSAECSKPTLSVKNRHLAQKLGTQSWKSAFCSHKRHCMSKIGKWVSKIGIDCTTSALSVPNWYRVSKIGIDCPKSALSVPNWYWVSKIGIDCPKSSLSVQNQHSVFTISIRCPKSHLIAHNRNLLASKIDTQYLQSTLSVQALSAHNRY